MIFQENCGKCFCCLDMTKFGGPNRLRKACNMRTCVRMTNKTKTVKEKWNTAELRRRGSRDHSSESSTGFSETSEMDNLEEPEPKIKNSNSVSSRVENPASNIISSTSSSSEVEVTENDKPCTVLPVQPQHSNIHPKPQSFTRYNFYRGLELTESDSMEK